jgi:dTDP-4-dehydrorhamnose reductase
MAYWLTSGVNGELVNLLPQSKEKIIVLGASGMLGQAVVRTLSSQPNLFVMGSFHSKDVQFLKVQSVDYFRLDASLSLERDLRNQLEGASHVVNCLGLIWQRAQAGGVTVPAKEFEIVNTVFAERVGEMCDDLNIRFIQVSTDCVFSGSQGQYLEDSETDTLEPYGKSKQLAEERLPNAIIFRSSVIGLSPGSGSSLLDWFLGVKDGESVSGYRNHRWNGVTNLAYARLLTGFIQHCSADTDPGIYHIVPKDSVSKYELLLHLREYFNKTNVSVLPTDHEKPTDRTLSTIHKNFNHKLWTCAGYSGPMHIEAMISELSKRLGDKLDV